MEITLRNHVLIVGQLIIAISLHAGSSKSMKPNEESSSMTESNKSPVMPHQFLISFVNEATSAERDSIISSAGAQMVEKVGSTPLFLIEIRQNEEKTLDTLRKNPKVRYVEPNFRMQTFKNKTSTKTTE